MPIQSFFFFFFSSRRRHTRFDCDWSSDVCSSDLLVGVTDDDLVDVRLRELLRLDTMLLGRSEEHTSELQSQSNLVCRLLLEKKKSARNRSSGGRSIPRRDSCRLCSCVLSRRCPRR